MIGVRFWSKVDRTEGCWIWTGTLHATGYGRFSDGYAHRLAFTHANGPIPRGMVIDHVCHTRACVNPEHLRLVTIKQNIENRCQTGRLRGVTFEKASGRWKAQVKHNRRQYNVGRYDTAEEAAEAARLKRLELFTHNDLDRM